MLGSYGPLDGMAGTLIAREAGARVVASSGGAEPVEGEALLCAAPGVAGALLELWRTHAGRVATS